MDSKNVIEEPSSWIEFEEIAQQPEVVAIGPCGLDYHRDVADSETQKEMFRRQIKLACDLNKPILVHERSAQEDVMEILLRYLSKCQYMNYLKTSFLSVKFSKFTTKDNQKLYGHCRGSECVFREWILLGIDRVLMQGTL